MLRILLTLATILTMACSSAPRAPATAAPQPTATTRPPTATPAPDYRGMRAKLVTPLSALIVAVRNNDRPNAATFLAQFNAAGEEILPAIATDVSKPANILHSAIVNVRAHPGDLAGLEEIRRGLIAEIP